MELLNHPSAIKFGPHYLSWRKHVLLYKPILAEEHKPNALNKILYDKIVNFKSTAPIA